jgi:hypothetical protein
MAYGNSRIFNRRRIMQGNRFLIIFIIMLLLIVTGGCGFIAWRDGPYKGRVIDAETGKPLEGVVVLGVWYKELPSPGGTVGSYFDAQETVTNKNGDFEVKGLGLQIFSTVSKMHVLIFKAGYEHIGSGLWGSLNLDGGLMKKKVAWEGERAIIPLRRLTMEERRNRFGSYYVVGVPDEKQKLLLKELKIENREIGK